MSSFYGSTGSEPRTSAKQSWVRAAATGSISWTASKTVVVLVGYEPDDGVEPASQAHPLWSDLTAQTQGLGHL